MSKTSQSYKQIDSKVQNMDSNCPKCWAINKTRKVHEGYPYCWSHLGRAQRSIIRKQKQLVVADRFGFYTRSLSDSIKLLRLKAEQSKDIGALSNPDVTEELILARLLVADFFEKNKDAAQLPLKDLTDVLNTISKIARTAQTITESDKHALSQEMLRAIINAISHAFHKANLHSTPEERATVFASEIARVFAGDPIEEYPASIPARTDNRPSYVDGEVQTV